MVKVRCLVFLCVLLYIVFDDFFIDAAVMTAMGLFFMVGMSIMIVRLCLFCVRGKSVFVSRDFKQLFCWYLAVPLITFILMVHQLNVINANAQHIMNYIELNVDSNVGVNGEFHLGAIIAEQFGGNTLTLTYGFTTGYVNYYMKNDGVIMTEASHGIYINPEN